YEVGSVYTHSIQTYKTGCKIISIGRSGFFHRYRNSPFIILHQENNRKLMERCKLESLGNFAFRNGVVAKTAHNYRIVFKCFKVEFLNILYSLSYACGWDGLHAGG